MSLDANGRPAPAPNNKTIAPHNFVDTKVIPFDVSETPISSRNRKTMILEQSPDAACMAIMRFTPTRD